MPKQVSRDIDVAWRKQATRNPVLVIRKRMSKDDRKALELAKRELGEKLKIIRQGASDDDVLPRLFASVSTYRGLADIEIFLRTIGSVTPFESSVHHNGFSQKKPRFTSIRRSL